MAYGRLDVFWPDGKFDSYLLVNPSVSVGRSAGCTIVLDTDTISRYHFSITLTDDEPLIADMDSANGTFVDGARLTDSEALPLQGGEEIQVGALRMIFHRMDDMPTLPLSELEDTQRYEREDIGFFIDVQGPPFAVPPGSHTSVEIALTNTSQDAQRYLISLTGLPGGWGRINRPEVLVNPDETAPILVNIKPPRRSNTTPGDYPVKIIAALKSDPDKRIEADITVRILPFSGFGMALASRRVTPYEPFRLHIHNQGSAGLPLYVMGRSKNDALRFAIAQPQMVLAPGQRLIVNGAITPRRRRWFGAPRDHSFDVMVRSRDEAAFLAVERGTYTEMALMPRWTAFALAALSLGVIVLLAAALALLLRQPPPEPQVLDFQAFSAEIARGEPLALTWQVENAERLVISVDGETVIDDLPGTVTTTEIDTSAYEGTISVRLEAVRGDLRATRAVGVVVYRPLVLDYFEVTPTTMVRDVVHSLNVRWRVAGAVETRVEGLDRYGVGGFFEPSYGPEGLLADVPGIPTEPFTLVLIAQDERGDVQEFTVSVEVVPARCLTAQANLTLYAEPSTSANVVSTVPEAGEMLVVTGRDSDTRWLRTEVEGAGEVWAPRDGLTCAENFAPENLRLVAQAIATEPAPTDPPQPTPTEAAVTPTPGS